MDEVNSALNKIAESYVKLVLRIGQYDQDLVDAYFGPADWKPHNIENKNQQPPEELSEQAESLLANLTKVSLPETDKLILLRHRFLEKHLLAMHSKLKILCGSSLSFDEESRALYDVIADTSEESTFKRHITELDQLLPGEGNLIDRLTSYRKRFTVPSEKMADVVDFAIFEARSRTKKHLTLPEQESFDVAYVKQKPWSAYNWYKGGFHSLIEFNTDFPLFIDRAIDLACHEGYPGHHVFYTLIEKQLLKGKNWVEFCINPLFCPQSLIAEGTANYGIELAFPEHERIEFEKNCMFPKAGLNAATADEYFKILEATKGLRYAGLEAARGYLNGKLSQSDAIEWLRTYALMDRKRAEQRLRFIEKYRSYIINYDLGEDLVKSYIEKLAGPNGTNQDKWSHFKELLITPHTASSLS